MSRSRTGLRAALAFVAVLAPGLAQALGLGEIEVRSRLNQPLTAVIPVLAADAGEVEGMTVELASNDEFERAGMERPQYLSTLRFELTGKTIKVSSKELAREPFVSFLLDVRWGGGRLLREYTVLLDPPTLAQREPARVPAPMAAPAPAPMAQVEQSSPPTTSPAASPPTPRPTPAPALPVPARAAAIPPAAMAGVRTYGPVAPQETLWSVALKTRPDPSLTMDQMQIAIFQANPTAFDGGQIGKLMKGVTLQIPSAAAIAAIDPLQAKAQVASGRVSSPAPAAAPQAEPVPETAAPTATPAAPAIAPEAASTPPSAVTGTTPAPDQAPATAPEAAGAAPAETEAAPTPTPVPAETPAAAPPAEPAAEDTGFIAELVDRLSGITENPLFLPGVGGFLLLLIVAIGAKKASERYAKWSYERASRKAEAPVATALGANLDVTAVAPSPSQPSLQSVLEAAAAAPPVAPPLAATQNLSGPGLQQTMQQHTMQQTQALEPALAATGGKVDFDVTGNFANETVQINLDAGDPVSEAEFHRAYGLYDEASLLLKQALQKDPDRKDARVKLAEIYFEASKAPEFIATARELKGQLTPDEWQKIALMGTQIAPGDELFAGGAAVGGSVDLSFDDVAPVATPAAAPAAAEPSLGDDLLDFKLDDVQLPETPAAAPAAAPANTESLLEFDLGLLDTPAAPAAPAAAPAAPARAAGDELNLDLGDFDLKLDSPGTAEPAPSAEPIGNLDLSGELSVEPVAGGDEASTKLDLARAYIDMGDNDMAKSLLGEVAQQGTPTQKKEAQDLLKRVGG